MPPADRGRLDRLRSWWRRRRSATGERSPQGEGDVAADTGIARTRAYGGRRPPAEVSDAATTTGAVDHGLFVGRAAGDDLGYAEETGAEARARTQPPRENEPKHHPHHGTGTTGEGTSAGP